MEMEDEPSTTHLDRMVTEHDELKLRLEKLSEFLSTDLFKSLDEDEQADLRKQHAAMVDYSDALWSRRQRAAQGEK